ncbi:MAG: hypothetical protein E7Z91_06880 [Cyanobacteria bacterium SIG30]|nr:hypothetical protein [Cyanobacteria bacterium SIG30]
MGCLKSIITKILTLALIFAFFYFGGVDFTIKMIKKYQNPPREKVIELAKTFGNFENVESDYKLGRTANTFKYSKLTVEHKPSSQKIIFIKVPSEKRLKKDDFNTKVVDEKLQNFIKDNNIQALKFENIEITKIGSMPLKTTNLDYVGFNVVVEKPLKQELSGFIGFYDLNDKNKKDENSSQAIIFSIRNKEKFSQKIVDELIQTVDFE